MRMKIVVAWCCCWVQPAQCRGVHASGRKTTGPLRSERLRIARAVVDVVVTTGTLAAVTTVQVSTR